MLYVPSIINVINATGVKHAKCIKIITKNVASIGTIVILSLKKTSTTKIYKKGQICKGLIVRVKKKLTMYDGSYFSLKENSAVLLQNEKLMSFQKMNGPLPLELKKNHLFKVISIKNIYI